MSIRTLLSTLLSTFMIACEMAENDGPTLNCDPDRVCWAHDDSWGADASAVDPEQLDEMEDSGVLEPAPELNSCWLIVGTDSHICVVEIDGVLLWGQPIQEMGPDAREAPSCGDIAGPWSRTFELDGICYGTINGIAIQLDI